MQSNTVQTGPRRLVMALTPDDVTVANQRAEVRVFPGSELYDEMISDITRLLDITAMSFSWTSEGVLLVDRLPLSVFDGGDPRPLPAQLAELRASAAAGGWITSEAGDGSWQTFRKEGQPVIHLGVRRLMPDDDPMVRPDDTPSRVVERLARYHLLVGASYRATPGVAGLAALRNFYDMPTTRYNRRTGTRTVPRQQPRWIWNAENRLTGCGDIIWQRKPQPGEKDFPLVMPYDVRAMYCAAAAGALLGWTAPEHTGAVMWDPSQSGFYRIIARGHEWANSRDVVPIVNANRVDSRGMTWVTAPILAYISECGYALPDIVDSWLCPDEPRPAKTILTTWAERMRDALAPAATAGDGWLRATMKRTYVESIGLMGAPGGRVYRQDWHHTIIDEARTRMLRKMHKAAAAGFGQPLRVRTDCAWYAVEDDGSAVELGAALGVGALVGQFRMESDKVQSMPEFLTMDARQRAARKAKANVQ